MFFLYCIIYNIKIQTEIDDETYNAAKDLYNMRRALPESDPEKMNSMMDWLKYYQLLDTSPLVQALDNCFGKLFELFQIDAHLHLSLPKISFT